jgi:hypothetical protein
MAGLVRLAPRSLDGFESRSEARRRGAARCEPTRQPFDDVSRHCNLALLQLVLGRKSKCSVLLVLGIHHHVPGPMSHVSRKPRPWDWSRRATAGSGKVDVVRLRPNPVRRCPKIHGRRYACGGSGIGSLHGTTKTMSQSTRWMENIVDCRLLVAQGQRVHCHTRRRVARVQRREVRIGAEKPARRMRTTLVTCAPTGLVCSSGRRAQCWPASPRCA